ncbi:hypothetical protein Pcinc_027965 [Petrolisthes cinctipes]|uniref:Rho-GAP domain-containing protein n=1 Tax=Petrolisthes cinctipes TaxID=88211 RepID=A0AAE1F3C4_PETCI|nr:hypothetical protein Pcinc_027965 [Petrolisthes cinctipes]
MQRLHLGPGTAGSATRQLGGGRLEAPSRRVRAALEEARGVPHPSPTRGRPALRLIDINPAEFLKYKVGVGNMGGVSEGVSGMRVEAFLRTPGVRKNSLFGVDLDTVSNRESGGGTVPLIIARCVMEVERRGLDIIGLYRLCGSATKKRLLRDAFERNPRLVDLSSDNVPISMLSLVY